MQRRRQAQARKGRAVTTRGGREEGRESSRNPEGERMWNRHLERRGVPQRRDTASLRQQAHSSPVSGRGFPLAKSTQKAVGGVGQPGAQSPGREGEGWANSRCWHMGSDSVGGVVNVCVCLGSTHPFLLLLAAALLYFSSGHPAFHSQSKDVPPSPRMMIL